MPLPTPSIVLLTFLATLATFGNSNLWDNLSVNGMGNGSVLALRWVLCALRMMGLTWLKKQPIYAPLVLSYSVNGHGNG
jgi:hypothetical protein